jgi:hypothetical protein
MNAHSTGAMPAYACSCHRRYASQCMLMPQALCPPMHAHVTGTMPADAYSFHRRYARSCMLMSQALCPLVHAHVTGAMSADACSCHRYDARRCILMPQALCPLVHASDTHFHTPRLRLTARMIRQRRCRSFAAAAAPRARSSGEYGQELYHAIPGAAAVLHLGPCAVALDNIDRRAVWHHGHG